MSPRQAKMLDAIRRLTVNGVSPSYRQLAHAVGLSGVSGVARMLAGMREAGLVHYTREHRSLVITGDGVSPAVLHKMTDAALNETAAHIAGVIASRHGDYPAAETYRRIADALLRSPNCRRTAA